MIFKSIRKKGKYPIRKIGQGDNQTITNEKDANAPKYMKICSVSALIKTMKIKSIMSYPFQTFRMAKINQNNGKDAG